MFRVAPRIRYQAIEQESIGSVLHQTPLRQPLRGLAGVGGAKGNTASANLPCLVLGLVVGGVLGSVIMWGALSNREEPPVHDDGAILRASSTPSARTFLIDNGQQRADSIVDGARVGVTRVVRDNALSGMVALNASHVLYVAATLSRALQTLHVTIGDDGDANIVLQETDTEDATVNHTVDAPRNTTDVVAQDMRGNNMYLSRGGACVGRPRTPPGRCAICRSRRVCDCLPSVRWGWWPWRSCFGRVCYSCAVSCEFYTCNHDSALQPYIHSSSTIGGINIGGRSFHPGDPFSSPFYRNASTTGSTNMQGGQGVTYIVNEILANDASAVELMCDHDRDLLLRADALYSVASECNTTDTARHAMWREFCHV